MSSFTSFTSFVQGKNQTNPHTCLFNFNFASKSKKSIKSQNEKIKKQRTTAKVQKKKLERKALSRKQPVTKKTKRNETEDEEKTNASTQKRVARVTPTKKKSLIKSAQPAPIVEEHNSDSTMETVKIDIVEEPMSELDTDIVNSDTPTRAMVPFFSRDHVNNTPSFDTNDEEEEEPKIYLTIDENEQDFYTLENAIVTGNRVEINVSQAERGIKGIEPQDIGFTQDYPGITGSRIKSSGGLTFGYLKIAPRTVKPFQVTRIEVNYFVLSGHVLARSTAHVSRNGRNFLCGKTYKENDFIYVPPLTPYTLENRSENTEALLGYIIVKKQDLSQCP